MGDVLADVFVRLAKYVMSNASLYSRIKSLLNWGVSTTGNNCVRAPIDLIIDMLGGI